MARRDYYPMPLEIVRAVRSADVLTGEFTRTVPSDASAYLRAHDLMEEDRLTERGVAVRGWLMRGAPSAPREVARLIGASLGD